MLGTRMRSRLQGEEGFSRPQHLLRRWDGIGIKQRRKMMMMMKRRGGRRRRRGGEEEEEDEGAVGLEPLGTGRPWRLEEEKRYLNSKMPRCESSLRRRVGVFENILVSMGGAESQRDGQKEKSVSSVDQESSVRLRRGLLLEDSTRKKVICAESPDGGGSCCNPLIQLAAVQAVCSTSTRTHQEMAPLQNWRGTNLEAITTCELCKEKLRLNIDNFDIQELYRTCTIRI
ncbi:hypothetical protein FQN60_011141 [Etheostoma spectabile]|uniref:RING-type E3 ubiquitin transferase n=1 Tax=Etheostoma spectabile TaxID=54343 RepID=A0A5J5DRC6_9PERO|nr:hypothetical protein FQN60_011141 [Etheostoma spectabile]